MIFYIGIFAAALLYSVLILVSLFYKSNSRTMKVIRAFSLPIVSVFYFLCFLVALVMTLVEFVNEGFKPLK